MREVRSGLARTRQTRDHHQLIARQGQIEILEVVLAGTLDVDVFHGLSSLRQFFAFSNCVQIVVLKTSFGPDGARPKAPQRNTQKCTGYFETAPKII